MTLIRRLLTPFVLALSAILALVYAYLAMRLADGVAGRLALAVPFLCIWLIPVVYWTLDREASTGFDEALHIAGYVSMGWLSFALVLSVARDALMLGASWLPLAPGVHAFLADWGGPATLAASIVALLAGMVVALRGPHVRDVEVPVADLDPDLHGLRIVQISDLHVGPTIGALYVRNVVRLANALRPDLVALTGDLVDGPVARLARHVAPLARLAPAGRVYLALGNHDYYSGAEAWTEHFRGLGMRVLLNEADVIRHGGATLVVGGVLDPAVATYGRRGQAPRPDLATAPAAGRAFRLLLAHNPRLARLGEAAGFDLQLSGHTHAGQFFPWTLAARWVHAPHAAGLSRRGRMWVHVSPGTGSWGPPVRFGTRPELTLLRLVRAAPEGAATSSAA